MKEKDIIARIRDMVTEEVEDSKAMKLAGKLNTAQGMRGFKTAEPGTPVWRSSDRYIIVMETLDGKMSAEVPYYMDTLQPAIDMCSVIE